jgi:uncharacterized protein (TIGR00730 family)
MNIKSVAIFCGSKTGNNFLFREDAVALGKILAENKIVMVYGGGKNGLMGAIADSVMQQGGTVKGVIPEVLISWEHQHENISELLVVEDMHHRKRMMYELCDAAIILPGGFGTLDELFEMLTWNQLSIHDKKIFILNTGAFYDHLLAHLKTLAEVGFLYGKLDEQITVLNEPREFYSYINY